MHKTTAALWKLASLIGLVAADSTPDAVERLTKAEQRHLSQVSESVRWSTRRGWGKNRGHMHRSWHKAGAVPDPSFGMPDARKLRRKRKRKVARALARWSAERRTGHTGLPAGGRSGMPQDLGRVVKSEASRGIIRAEWRGTAHRVRGRHRARWERLRAQEKAIARSAAEVTT